MLRQDAKMGHTFPAPRFISWPLEEMVFYLRTECVVSVGHGGFSHLPQLQLQTESHGEINS